LEQLRSSGKLDASTRVEADENHRALIAYATPNDQLLIASLVQQLDTGGRRFEVISTGALPAAEVAGTIEYIFRRSSGGRSSNGRDDERLCVEADVARNQIVVCGNEAELAQVRELTAKLGLDSAPSQRHSLVRVMDTRGQPTKVLLEQLRRLWPREAANPLEIVPAESATPAGSTEETTGAPPDERPSKAATARQRESVRLSVAKPGPERLPRADSFALARQPLEAVFSAVATLVLPLRAKRAEEQAAGPDELPPAAGLETDASRPSDAPAAPRSAPADGGGASPVRVTSTPDGRLIVTSPDPEALDRFGQLLEGLLPKGEDYRVFRLEHASAYLVRMNLEDVFSPDGGGWRNDLGDDGRPSGPRLSERQPLRFVSDSDTNTVLVQHASAEQLEQIERLIETYDRPERLDPQTARVTEIVALKHAKAAELAEMVKEVFRDLLSDNDKSLGQGQQQEQRRGFNSGGSRGKTRPQFKGQLSLGVDELSNQLIVSAPQFLVPDVVQMIERLDRSAASYKVSVLALGGGVDALQMQETLTRFLGQAPSGGSQPNAQNGRPRTNRANGRRFDRAARGSGGN
jgi:hypothetical protein